MTHEALIDAIDSDETRPEVKSYGDALRSAREALGFSIDEVAIELHLASDVIVHMEQGAVASLPDPIFVRGYLRAYAKLVQIDPDQVILSFNRVCVPNEHKKLNLGKHIVIKEMKAGGEKPMRWVSYIIFVGLIVLLLMWWHSHNSQTDNADNGTMAALATLKPVSDNSVTSTLPTQAVASTASDGTGMAGDTTAATANATGNGLNQASTDAVAGAQAETSNNPNVIVNTNVQNLAPSSNAAAAVSSTGAAPAAATQSGQSLANTPTPVVGSTPASVNGASASVSSSSTKPAKTKGTAPAASTWRNPDLD